MSDSEKINAVKAINIKENDRLSTGSINLDQILNGGFPSVGIIELTGESGCGKSQLCQQLTLTVQYPLDQGGFNGGAVYICTEELFPSRRLYQLIENFPQRYYRQKNNKIDFGSNILIVHIRDTENLELCLKKVESIIKSKNIKIIIIDSITAIFRGNYDASDGLKKVKELRNIGNILHKLSMNYNILIVCVNQVAQSITENETVPALGLAWANLVTTRLLLSRNGDLRQLKVIFSPELPSKISADFLIEASGII